MMELVTTSCTLRALIDKSGGNRRIGFVPTMGALHQGHLELVKRAVRENDIVVVSIFVNPTQFNDPEDLKRYPRDLGADCGLLEPTGCHYVYAPSVHDVYPERDTRIFDFGGLDSVMEGRHRPGHFNGVAQVVTRLFDIVGPSSAYFGLKDFQQLAVIKYLVRQMDLPVNIVPCPIVREPSGLAMSSRNRLLSEEERLHAAKIYETLTLAKDRTTHFSVPGLICWMHTEISSNPFLDVEYIDIVDDSTLLTVHGWDHPGGIVACVAVWCGNVRLIDNVVFK